MWLSAGLGELVQWLLSTIVVWHMVIGPMLSAEFDSVEAAGILWTPQRTAQRHRKAQHVKHSTCE